MILFYPLPAHPRLYINLSKSELHLYKQFRFLGLHWDEAYMFVSLPLDKHLGMCNLATSLLQNQSASLPGHVLFGQEQFLC